MKLQLEKEMEETKGEAEVDLMLKKNRSICVYWKFKKNLRMENPNEDQDQIATSSTLMGSSGRPVPVEDIHVQFAELFNAATASGSNERASDQASNSLADDVIAPLATGVIADINCEVDAEPRQPPGSSQRQPSTNEDLTLNLQAQEIEKSTQYFCGICQENVQF